MNHLENIVKAASNLDLARSSSRQLWKQ